MREREREKDVSRIKNKNLNEKKKVFWRLFRVCSKCENWWIFSCGCFQTYKTQTQTELFFIFVLFFFLVGFSTQNSVKIKTLGQKHDNFNHLNIFLNGDPWPYKFNKLQTFFYVPLIFPFFCFFLLRELKLVVSLLQCELRERERERRKLNLRFFFSFLKIEF